MPGFSSAGFEPLEARRLLAADAQLLADLQPSGDSSPSDFVRAGTTTFFVANETQLWKTDGSRAGTELVRDLRDMNGGDYQYVASLTDAGGTLAFAFLDLGADTSFDRSDDRLQLWKSDGSTGGTVLVKDFGEGSSGTLGGRTDLTFVGGTLFGVVSTAAEGRELWKSDLTASGTKLVKDIAPGTGDSNPRYLTSFNGQLYFAANDGTNGEELWRSDGSEAGTLMVRDIRPGDWSLYGTTYPASSYPRGLKVVGDQLFFAAFDPGGDHAVDTEDDNSLQLWKSDGTQDGTVMVYDFGEGSRGYAPELTDVGGTLFGVVATAASGSELWKSDGTAAGTELVSDLRLGTLGSYPSNLLGLNGVLYFTADDGRGYELWKTDGSLAGTELVKDIETAANPFGSFPSSLVEFGGLLIFAASTNSSGRELWRSDGTRDGTFLLRDIAPGAANAQPEKLTNIDGVLYFAANDQVHGIEPWTVTDRDLGFDFGDAPDPSFPTLLINDGARHQIGSALFLGATVDADPDGQPQADAQGDDTDGSNDDDGVRLRAPLLPGYETGITVNASSDGRVDAWFDFDQNGVWDPVTEKFLDAAPVAAGRNEFTITIPADAPTGTAAARFRVSTAGSPLPKGLAIDGEVEDYRFTVLPAACAACRLEVLANTNDPGGGAPGQFVEFNGAAWFVSNRTQLWKTDGTAAGTVLVRDLDTGSGTFQYVSDLTDVNGTLAFALVDLGAPPPDFDTSDDRVQLWKSDGTAAGTSLVKDFGSGSTTSGFKLGLELTRVADRLFGVVSTPATGAELWTSDLTTDGTDRVKDIQPGPVSSSPKQLTEFRGALFFVADEETYGEELWKSDGTSGGTVLVKDVLPGQFGGYHGTYSASSYPTELTVAGDSLFFTAFHFGADEDPFTPDDNRAQLWRSDGTPAGTVLVHDFGPGSYGSNSQLTAVGTSVFGVFSTPATGQELWKHSRTSGVTQLVKDIYPGDVEGVANSASPADLTEVDGVLYFTARDGLSGREVWKSDGTSAGTELVRDIHPVPEAASNAPGPSSLINVDGMLVFVAYTENAGKELWMSDGTAAGTVLVRDLLPGTGSSNPAELRSFDRTLLFAADNGQLGSEPWSLIVPTGPRWQNYQMANPLARFDVNASGGITSHDALVVLNRMNTQGPGPVPVVDESPPPFFDVSGDDFITPLDVLQIINWLNANAVADGEGPAPAGVPLLMTVAAQQPPSTTPRSASTPTRVTRGEPFATPDEPHRTEPERPRIDRHAEAIEQLIAELFLELFE